MMSDDKTESDPAGQFGQSGQAGRAGRAGTAHASGDEPGFTKGEWLPPRMRKDVDISIPYSDPPTDKLMEFYAAWAENYDTDLIDAYGYMAPTDAVAGLMTLGLPADARILDAGCGTGQAGALMAAAGFTNIDGADLSPEMRAVAGRLGVYKYLYHLDMTADYAPQIADYAQPADGPYDAVICVGVFGYGPPHVGDLPRIMDAARPGAPVLVTVNGKGWEKTGWDDNLMPVLDAAGVSLAARTRIRHMVKEGVHAELLELRRG
jgi:SAM-dependent methyltransferase